MKWLDKNALLIVHNEQIAEHGGGAGVRAMDLLDSALARAEHKAHYEKADVFACAAAYGFGIARNHPFVDGNKRTALLAIDAFLTINGQQLVAAEADAYDTIMALADGSLDEKALAEWARANAKPIRSGRTKP